MKTNYQSVTVKDLIIKMNNNSLVLPPIQRDFVWDEDQITNMFDSLMRDYPIGVFLFWNADKKTIADYQFEKFEKDYDQYKAHIGEKRKTVSNLDVESNETVTAVLDGQQRLTALLIGFIGSINVRLKYKRLNDPNGYQKKELYIDLDYVSDPSTNSADDYKYRFAFLADEETEKAKGCWFRVKDIAEKWNGTRKDKNNKLKTQAIKKSADKDRAKGIIDQLWTLYNKDQKLSYYNVDNTNIQDILNIFERVNAGGTVLTRTQLLFSIISIEWKEAKKSFEDLKGRVNALGFNIDDDFVMKTCLFLTGKSVGLGTSSFEEKHIKCIKDNWECIKKAVYETFLMICQVYNDKGIISYNSLLPVVLFRYKKIKEGKKPTRSDGKEIWKYIFVAQTRGVFRSSTNTVLDAMRRLLEEKYKSMKNVRFRISYFKEFERNGVPFFKLDNDYIEEILSYSYGDKVTLLTLLYLTDKKIGEVDWQVDHMHPQVAFDKKKPETVSKDDWEEWKEMRHLLPNLQLLAKKEHPEQKGLSNQEKRSMELINWLNKYGISDSLLPEPADGKSKDEYYHISNFKEFYKDREKLLRKELKEKLDIK